MKVRAKVTEINAICHLGPSPLTVMGIKGQQDAKKGDYIFMHGTDPSTFEVVKKADFDDKYEVVAEVSDPAPVPESFDMKSGYHEYNIYTVTSSPVEKYAVMLDGAGPDAEKHYFNTVADAEAYIETISPTQHGSEIVGTDPEPPMPHADEEKVEEPTA